MTAAERRESIISMFQKTDFVKITDIVSRFDISNETARRDLDYLQDQQLIRRVYGGAILKDRPPFRASAVSRRSHLTAELQAIGEAGANLIKAGETVFMTNGSTVLQVARHLRNRSDITVVTNSLAVINELADTDITVFVIGGCLDNGEHDIHGNIAQESVKMFYCDKAFFGCGGMTKNLDVMDYAHSSPIHSHVIGRSSQHILVTSSQKFGMPAFIYACRLEDVDIIITDNKLTQEYQDMIQELGIQLILVDASSTDFED